MQLLFKLSVSAVKHGLVWVPWRSTYWMLMPCGQTIYLVKAYISYHKVNLHAASFVICHVGLTGISIVTDVLFKFEL